MGTKASRALALLLMALAAAVVAAGAGAAALPEEDSEGVYAQAEAEAATAAPEAAAEPGAASQPEIVAQPEASVQQADPGAPPADENADGPGNSEDAPGQNKPEGGAGAQQGPPDEPPGCNGTIHLGGGQGTDPKYTVGENIVVNGSGFDASEAFTHWTVVDVNDGSAAVASGGGWPAGGDGSFSFTAMSTSGLTDGHEYKLTVYWNETLPNGETKECHKSKNFFVVAASGGSTPGGSTPEGSTPETATPPSTESSSGSGTTGSTTGGGVAGESATVDSNVAGGGVLGAEAGGTLPFTGTNVWVFALLGAALAAAGFGLRRTAGRTR